MSESPDLVKQWYEATMARGVRQGTCLLWPGCTNTKGYGRVRVPVELSQILRIKPRTPATLHRAIYAYHHYLNRGLHMSADPIDHLCCTSACYELSHLRHVSHAVNQRRALNVRMYGKPEADEWNPEASDWL